MLLTIRTISRPLIRAIALLTGLFILVWGGYSIVDAYEGQMTTHFAFLLVCWSLGLIAAAIGVMLMTLIAQSPARARRTEESPWTDIPDDLPMVAQFDASVRASRDDRSAYDVSWTDIPDDLPMVAQFDASVRASEQDILSAEDAPWADFPDDLPAVAQFDEYLRTYSQNAASADDSPWADLPDDLPAVAQFDEYLRTYSQKTTAARGWKGALVRWIQEVPDAALARREYLRNTEAQEYMRFYGTPGQLATAGVNALADTDHRQKGMGGCQALGQSSIARRIYIRRSSDSQLLQ